MAGSLGRMLAMIDVFTEQTPSWSADALCETLHYTRPTGYRYLKELVKSGLLQRLPGGYYALGPRVIALDFIVRSTDPVMQRSQLLLRKLVAETECSCMLAALFGNSILQTHVEAHELYPLPPEDTRGKVRPLFRGSMSKILLAYLPRPRLRAVYRDNVAVIAEAGLGADWESFMTLMASIRRRGYYVSFGEVNLGYAALAVPIFGPEKNVSSALSVATTRERFAQLDEALILRQAQQAAAEMSTFTIPVDESL